MAGVPEEASAVEVQLNTWEAAVREHSQDSLQGHLDTEVLQHDLEQEGLDS